MPPLPLATSERSRSMTRLLYPLSDNKLRFAYILLFGLSLNVISAVTGPLVMKMLIDEGLIKRNFTLFAVFAWLVVLCGVGIQVISLAYELLAQKFKNSV